MAKVATSVGLATFFALLIGVTAPSALAQAVGGGISGDRVDVIEREARPSFPEEAETEQRPFGANLFAGGFRAEREDGFNPSYVVQPGDQILVRVWGSTSFEETTVVDAQGNIFIPEVGPIHVVGVLNSELTEHISKAVARVFTQNIRVYTNVAGTTPVVVYVAGYVKKPGSYAGVASDSLLFFLDRAGGMSAESGSYRDVRVLRDGTAIARADLYGFLLEGAIPKVQFEDGDTIVVGRRGGTVSVQGAVRNPFDFELLPSEFTGATLQKLADPEANASHVALKGSRREGPVSAYLSLAEFARLTLQDGDQVIFEADEREDTMLIRVEGSHLGPSRFAVPRDMRLHQLLDYIEIDPNLTDITSVSLQRESIRERQEQALDAMLRRLEAAALSSTSQTDAESQIRANEAKLITDFVERAKNIKPDGVLVVALNGRVQDVQLQPEDVITIPQRDDVVLVSGEVSVPQAVVYQPGETVDDYIARAGGYTNRADPRQLLIVRRSGEVLRNKRDNVRPGDEIMVLPDVPVKGLEIAKTIIQAIFQIAVTTGIVLGI